MSLGATEKEPHSNAGSWGRDPGAEQSERTGQDQKANQGGAAGVDGGGGAGQARPAGTPHGGLWYPGEGTFYWSSQEGPEKGTPAPIWCPGFSQTARRGRQGARERSREGTHGGLATGDLDGSSHLAREPRISLPPPASGKGWAPGRFVRLAPRFPTPPQPFLQVSCPPLPTRPTHLRSPWAAKGGPGTRRPGRVRDHDVGAVSGEGCQGWGECGERCWQFG